MPTVNDVARLAGVSPITVSRVVNGAANVRPVTAQRVERAIRELGYVPNVAARGLRSKRTHSLALLVPDITNPFWTTVARAIEDAAQRQDYWVFLCNTDEDPAKQERYLAVVAGQRVDGVILAPFNGDLRPLNTLRAKNMPTVLMDRRVAGWEGDWIGDDSIANARAVVRILIARGHRRIAVVSGPAGASTADERVMGYRLALREAGIPVEEGLVRRTEFRAGPGAAAVAELLDLPSPPSAIFAANHLIGQSVAHACQGRGVRVPDDLTVACIDAPLPSNLGTPCEVVVAHPAYEMGFQAANLLLSRLACSEPLAGRTVVLSGRILAGAPGLDFESPGSQVAPLTEDERRRVPAIMEAAAVAA